MFARLLKLPVVVLFAFVAAVLSMQSAAQPALYVEGTHYKVLPDNPLSRAQTASATPLVTEIFWYGCPSCFNFDPLLEQWVQAQGSAISFSRSPTVWDDNTQKHARLFAASAELGLLEQVHAKIFAAIHLERNTLLDDKAQLAFLQANGSTAEQAQKALTSFSVDSEVRKADALQRALKVPGIPAMIVRGRYMVNLGGPNRTYDDLLKVVKYLVSADPD